MICIEAALDAVTTGAAHDDLTQHTEDTATDLTIAHCTGYITDHPNIKVHQVTNLKITVGLIHNHATDLQGMNCAD